MINKCEMEAGRDIYRVSAPMVAGVLLAAAVCRTSQTIAYGHIITGTSALLAFGLLLCACVFAARGNAMVRNPLLWILLFAATGACCYMSRITVLPAILPRNPLASVSAYLAGLIADIPFADKENNALLQAIILGDRGSLGTETAESFRKAGAAHMLALSGMHLGIIYAMITRSMMILGNSIAARKIRSAAVIVLTGLYTLMCGAGPSLQRAWLFILLGEGGRLLDRPQPLQQVFCAALTLHLVFRPESATQLGFQLSYLALVGIVFVWPHMREWYPGRSLGARIWQAMSLAICCQLFTAPLSWWHFGTFPKYFLITNLVAAPVMGIAMFTSVGAILARMLWTSAPMWLFTVLEMPLSLLRYMLDTIATLP